MPDRPMDAFDARVSDLMTAYGDRAVTAFDVAEIARRATARRPSLRHRLGLDDSVGRGASLLLLAAAVALLALAASFTAGGSPPPPALTSRIVLGPAGPEYRHYRVPLGPPFELTLENRSDLTWLPWSGLAEKFGWCHLISGAPVPANPCSVAPHSTIALTPDMVTAGRTAIDFAPPGVDFNSGIRVTVDVVAGP